MKKLTLSFLILILLTGKTFSQKTEEKEDVTKKTYIGAGVIVNTRMGINTTTIEGFKNKVAYSPLGDIGISGAFIFEGNAGFVLNLLSSNYVYGIYPHNDDQAVTTVTLNSMAINPVFWYYGFYIGYNYVFSVDGKTEDGNFPFLEPQSFHEICAGAMIPVYENAFGRLNFNIAANYALSYAQEGMIGNLKASIQPVSFALGFSYYFKFILD
jgi:hypothetical protein